MCRNRCLAFYKEWTSFYFCLGNDYFHYFHPPPPPPMHTQKRRALRERESYQGGGTKIHVKFVHFNYTHTYTYFGRQFTRALDGIQFDVTRSDIFAFEIIPSVCSQCFTMKHFRDFCPIFTKVIHRKRTSILQHRKIAGNLIVHLP